MKCPFCGDSDQKVLDSRPARDGEAIRRRRECTGCGRRFSTYEEPERPRLFVLKRDGSRCDFSRDKLLHSMVVATRKRNVPMEILRTASERIERDLYQAHEDEVTTRDIGEHVLRVLFELDTVAYVRYASVFEEFETLADFRSVIERIGSEETVSPGVMKQG
ncbi:MAG: transcriptional repressor NrdR [Armatimonadetes bacterium]|nr:transcriptional repressor NrdR [Armatimonadota bacterium]